MTIQIKAVFLYYEKGKLVSYGDFTKDYQLSYITSARETRQIFMASWNREGIAETILDRIVKEDSSEEITFEHRPECSGRRTFHAETTSLGVFSGIELGMFKKQNTRLWTMLRKTKMIKWTQKQYN